jgi:hypothetical protein
MPKIRMNKHITAAVFLILCSAENSSCRIVNLKAILEPSLYFTPVRKYKTF